MNSCIHDKNKLFICNKCYEILCSKCKDVHMHNEDIKPISHLNSEISFILEEMKAKYEQNITPFITIYSQLNSLINYCDEFVKVIKQTKNNIDSACGDLTKKEELYGQTITEWNTLSTNNKKERYLTFYNTGKDYISEVNYINENVINFDHALEQFSKCWKYFDTYANEKQIYLEKYIMDVNSNLGTIVKKKFENANRDFFNKISKIEEENKKLTLVNENLLSKIEELKKGVNKAPLMQDSPKALGAKEKEANSLVEIDFQKDEKEISVLICSYLVNRNLNEKHYKKLDEYDTQSFVRSSYQQITSILSLPQLTSQYYTSVEMVKEEIKEEMITSSKLYQSYMSVLSSSLKEKLLLYIFQNIGKLLEDSQISTFVYQSYFTHSKEMASIKALDLKGRDITDADMNKIMFIINYNPRIVDVYLQNNKLTDVGLSTFFRELKEGNKIKNIYFNNNSSITSAAIKSFKDSVYQSVKKYSALKIISFENNACKDDKKAKELMREIKKKLKIIMSI